MIEGLDLERAAFRDCGLAQYDDPGFSTVVRDVGITSSWVSKCVVHGIRFEDVNIDQLSMTSPQHLDGCVFRHVTLKGRIGPIMTAPVHYSLAAETQAAFNAAIVAYYKDVDWAIDISQAHFSDADFSLVPGDRVRRDPETQFLLRREVVAQLDGSRIGPYAGGFLRRFETSPFDSLVAIAPRRSNHFRHYLADFERLRRDGLAE